MQVARAAAVSITTRKHTVRTVLSAAWWRHRRTHSFLCQVFESALELAHRTCPPSADEALLQPPDCAARTACAQSLSGRTCSTQ